MPAARPTSSASTPRVTAPAEIHSVKAVDRDSGVDIDVAASRALVWTTYRDVEGNLVIELPNSVPANTVGDLFRAEGLLSTVAVERLDDAERPLTRLVIRTREDTEHSLTTEGETLRLQLLPVGYEPAAEIAYEPLSDAEDAPPPAAEPPTMAAPPSAAVRAYGTPETPQSGPPVTGVAATRLTGVEVLSLTDQTTVIQIAGDGELRYATFRLESPERFVIDLEGVVNTSVRSTVPVASDAVDQIRIGQFKPSPDPVSRVVFDLRQFTAPLIERGSDGLTVIFGSLPGSEPAPATTLAEDVEADDLPEPAQDQGEPARPTVIASAQEPPAEELPMATEPDDSAPALAEPTAVADAGEAPGWLADEPADEPAPPPVAAPPVAVYEPAAPPEQTAAAAPPSAARPPSVGRPVETSDVALFEANQVSFERADDEPAQEQRVLPPSFQSLVVSSSQKVYVGEPITMSLKNADLVETLRSFSRISDLNFVIQPGVSGSVTVELTGVPWDQALEQILKINNLGMDIDGTIVRIAPLTQLRAEAEEQRRLAQLRQQTVPLRTVMRSLSYADATAIATLLENRTGGRRGSSRGTILSTRGSVQVDDRTNTLIIRELPDVIDTVLAVIDNLDTPEPQVKIEARIIEATKNFSRSLGVQWNFSGIASNEFGNTTGLEFPNNVNTSGGVNLLTGGDNGFLNLTLGNVLNTFTLDTALLAAENEGLVNVVSAPSVMTLNNERAVIQSGIQVPIQTVANNTVTVQFVNATLQLSVEPHVTAEGTILMEIQVSKKEPQPALIVAGSTNTPIATREAQTRVIVRDGGTAVIGGIYEVSTNQRQDRVPGLANIPIIGHIFKNRARENNNQELLIFVTPRIIQM